MSRKSYKREIGAGILFAAAVINIEFWTMSNPALVSAYASAYGTAMLAMLPTGLAPFGIHHIWEKKPEPKP